MPVSVITAHTEASMQWLLRAHIRTSKDLMKRNRNYYGDMYQYGYAPMLTAGQQINGRKQIFLFHLSPNALENIYHKTACVYTPSRI